MGWKTHILCSWRFCPWWALNSIFLWSKKFGISNSRVVLISAALRADGGPGMGKGECVGLPEDQAEAGGWLRLVYPPRTLARQGSLSQITAHWGRLWRPELYPISISWVNLYSTINKLCKSWEPARIKKLFFHYSLSSDCLWNEYFDNRDPTFCPGHLEGVCWGGGEGQFSTSLPHAWLCVGGLHLYWSGGRGKLRPLPLPPNPCDLEFKCNPQCGAMWESVNRAMWPA